MAKIMPMENFEIYEGIGLKDLKIRGDLAIKTRPQVLHTEWLNREDIFIEDFLPLLK